MLHRVNPTEYEGDTFFDASEESLVTNISNEESENEDVPMKCELNNKTYADIEIQPSPDAFFTKKTYTDCQTQADSVIPATIETQTEKNSNYCVVCGGDMDCAFHNEHANESCPLPPRKDEVIADPSPPIDPDWISPSMINLCSSQTRSKLFVKNVVAIKKVALKLLEVCDNPTDTDVESDVKILQTLSNNLKALKTMDPTVCVPVIIKLDKRMVAGEGGPGGPDNKRSSHSGRSIRFSISHDFADDILDDMEDDMSHNRKYRKSGFPFQQTSSDDEVQDDANLPEKPLTNSSPKGSLDVIAEKAVKQKQAMGKQENIPQLARNITKLLKDKRNKEKAHKVHKVMKEKHPLTPQCSPTSIDSDNIDSKKPTKLGINIKATNNELDIPNMGMCNYRISGGNADLVCPFTEQTQCDCLVKLPSFLSKSNI